MKGRENVLRRIAERRAELLEEKGPTLGSPVPLKREVPLVSFGRKPFLITEIKRKSPSKGDIAPKLDAEIQAGFYRKAGALNISVLTETERFGGSLNDLMDVKRAFPDLSVLRKDFLLSVEDIRVSYRAGADACLLIASLLDQGLLKAMHEECEALGMAALVELHTDEDIEKARNFKPSLVGINSRDLRYFTVNPLIPLKVRAKIDWPCRVIFESGVLKETDGAFVRGCGFDGMLVGEGVVRDPKLPEKLVRVLLDEPEGVYAPWPKLMGKIRGNRPLVKVCGLTREEDYLLAEELGADMTGFILAESPRKVSPGFVRSLPKGKSLRVGVVVLGEGEDLPASIEALLDSGALDLIQFHGSETPEMLLRYPGYKALRVKGEADLEMRQAYYPLPCLLDAFSREAHGGTGKRIDSELAAKAARNGELWLAGGLNPGNIREVLDEFSPSLVDVSSGMEQSPGIKDHNKMRAFFKEVDNA